MSRSGGRLDANEKNKPQAPRNGSVLRAMGRRCCLWPYMARICSGTALAMQCRAWDLAQSRENLGWGEMGGQKEKMLLVYFTRKRERLEAPACTHGAETFTNRHNWSPHSTHKGHQARPPQHWTLHKSPDFLRKPSEVSPHSPGMANWPRVHVAQGGHTQRTLKSTRARKSPAPSLSPGSVAFLLCCFGAFAAAASTPRSCRDVLLFSYHVGPAAKFLHARHKRPRTRAMPAKHRRH